MRIPNFIGARRVKWKNYRVKAIGMDRDGTQLRTRADARSYLETTLSRLQNLK
jgi:hypothetical protein